MSQLTESLKEAKGAEKEVRAEVAGVLREGRSAQQALAAAEAAAEKAVSSSVARHGRAGVGSSSSRVCARGGSSQESVACAFEPTRPQPASQPASTHARRFSPKPDITQGSTQPTPCMRVMHQPTSPASLPCFQKKFNLVPLFSNPLSNRPQARQEAAAKAVLEAAKKAGSAGELLTKRELQAIFQQALNPPKEQAALTKVRGLECLQVEAKPA